MFTKVNQLVQNENNITLGKNDCCRLRQSNDVLWFLLDEEEKLIAHADSVSHCLETDKNLQVGMLAKDIFSTSLYEKIFPVNINQNKEVIEFTSMLNGIKCTFEFESSVIHNDHKKYYHIILNDITVLKKLEQKVWEDDKIVQSAVLAMGMVHEIRNPLTSIRGFLQLLQAGVKQEAAYYNVMINEVDKLEEITQNLLQLSKPYGTQKENEKIGDIVKDVHLLFETQVDMKGIVLQLNIEDDLDCFCNKVQIKQVLLNLIKNAAEAMEYEGLIQINAFLTEDKDNIVLEVIDSGTGITDEMIYDMTTPFYTTKKDGTGLGLVISHELIGDHGGSFSIGNHQNGGMIATIILPRNKV